MSSPTAASSTTVSATSPARGYFWLGTSAILLAVLVYIVLNIVIQSRYLDAKRRLEELASVDALTGIANRRTFDHHLATECRAAIRKGQALSLLMIDIDYFKLLNDSLGHIEGDRGLATVAQAIRNLLKRADDLVARYGGEEFVLLLPMTELAGTLTVAHRITTALVLLPLKHPTSPLGRVTVGIGVYSALVSSDMYPDRMVQQADQALYRAKGGGRNRIVAAPRIDEGTDTSDGSLHGEAE